MHFLRDAIEHISIKPLYLARSTLAPIVWKFNDFDSTLALNWGIQCCQHSSVQRSTTKIILTNHCAAPSASSVEWINHWFICTCLDIFLTFCCGRNPQKIWTNARSPEIIGKSKSLSEKVKRTHTAAKRFFSWCHWSRFGWCSSKERPLLAATTQPHHAHWNMELNGM